MHTIVGLPVKESVLSLRTSEDWEVSELTVLLRTVESMYGVFAGLLYLKTTPSYNSRELSPSDMLEPPLAESRLLALLTQGWHRRSAANALGYGTRSGLVDYERDQRDLLDALRDTAFRNGEGVLAIRSIRIQSPGFISFQGLGEPIAQLRELIKDLWYRNRQEKEKGELEIAETRIKLKQLEYGLPMRNPDVYDRATLILANGLWVIRELESRGRLAGVPEGLEDEEE